MERVCKRAKVDRRCVFSVSRDVIVNVVMPQLAVKDLVSLAATCRRFRAFARCSRLWKGLVARDFCVTVAKTDDPYEAYVDEFFFRKKYPMHLPYTLKMRAYHAACTGNRLDRVRCFLRHGIGPADFNSFGFRWACIDGHSEIVEYLLRDGRADPGALDNFAFQEACREGHVDVVKLLLKHERVDPVAGNNRALLNAYRFGQSSVVAVLFRDGRVVESIVGRYKQ